MVDAAANDGRIETLQYATETRDGDLKIWDGARRRDNFLELHRLISYLQDVIVDDIETTVSGHTVVSRNQNRC